MLKLGIDIDGTITSNIEFFRQFTEFHKKDLLLFKGDYNHEIHIITTRPKKWKEFTRTQLKDWGIRFDIIACVGNEESAGLTKAKYCKENNIDILYDNECFKDDFWEYFNKISPNTSLVLI